MSIIERDPQFEAGSSLTMREVPKKLSKESVDDSLDNFLKKPM